MWRKITGNDVTEFQDFYAIQKNMNILYELKQTPSRLQTVFEKRQDQNIQVFIYEDGDIKMNLCVKDSDEDQIGLHMFVTGTDSLIGDMEEKCRIIHHKFQELMDEYDETEGYGIWMASEGSNYSVGEAFFDKFCHHCKDTNGAAYDYSACDLTLTQKPNGKVDGELRMYR